jgi:hypothetical protein
MILLGKQNSLSISFLDLTVIPIFITKVGNILKMLNVSCNQRALLDSVYEMYRYDTLSDFSKP